MSDARLRELFRDIHNSMDAQREYLRLHDRIHGFYPLLCIPQPVRIYRNGMLMRQGDDYVDLGGPLVWMSPFPLNGDIVRREEETADILSIDYTAHW